MSGAATEQPKPFDWHDEYAYSLGVTALIYGFPYVYGAQIRHKWVTQPEDPEHVPYSAVNRFWHAPGVLDASYQDGGCPNNDTLYSVAWVDLTEEPIILSHPEMGIGTSASSSPRSPRTTSTTWASGARGPVPGTS